MLMIFGQQPTFGRPQVEMNASSGNAEFVHIFATPARQYTNEEFCYIRYEVSRRANLLNIS